MNKNNKFIFIFYLYIHTSFLLCIFYFLSFYFFIYIFGLGPAQPTWAGLDPASPARSLAQASDPAGQKKLKARVTCSRMHEHWWR
jgi:hypothetical protein